MSPSFSEHRIALPISRSTPCYEGTARTGHIASAFYAPNGVRQTDILVPTTLVGAVDELIGYVNEELNTYRPSGVSPYSAAAVTLMRLCTRMHTKEPDSLRQTPRLEIIKSFVAVDSDAPLHAVTVDTVLSENGSVYANGSDQGRRDHPLVLPTIAGTAEPEAVVAVPQPDNHYFYVAVHPDAAATNGYTEHFIGDYGWAAPNWAGETPAQRPPHPVSLTQPA